MARAGRDPILEGMSSDYLVQPDPADPRLTPEQKASGDITNSRAIIDACKPFHWKDQFPTVNAPGLDVLREAREKFGYLMD